MSIPEFGRSLDEVSEDIPEFGRPLDEEEKPSFRESFTARAKSIRKAALRGGVKGVRQFAELTPLPTLGPVSPEFGEEQLLEMIGEPQEKFAEKTIERGVPLVPYAFGGGGSLAARLGRTALAATMGQATEEMGGGPLLQALAEITAFGGAGFRKKIVSTRAQAKGVEMLRRRGLAEKEIAPILPSERKSAFVGKFGIRGFRTKKASKRTQDALGNVFESLKTEGKDLPILATDRSQALKSNLETIMIEKVPIDIREKISQEMTEVFNKPVKANNLIKLYQRINRIIRKGGVDDAKKTLNALKTPISNAMEEISPRLAKDFELLNTLYGQFKTIAPNLTPRKIDTYLSFTELGAFFTAIGKGSIGGAATVVGTDIGRRIMTEMLVNPRFQNLTQQMFKAINNNKLSIAKEIDKAMKKELKKKGIDISKLTQEEKVES